MLSRAFTITFILLASFIFLSMFVGVMIIHTEVRLRVYGPGVCSGVAGSLRCGPKSSGRTLSRPAPKVEGRGPRGSSLPSPTLLPEPVRFPASGGGGWPAGQGLGKSL